MTFVLSPAISLSTSKLWWRCSTERGSYDHGEDCVRQEGEGDDGWRHGNTRCREFADVQ